MPKKYGVGKEVCLYKKLDQTYFARETLLVAKDLIGKYLIHELAKGEKIICRIVETEGYKEYDPACHAYANCLRRDQGLAPKGRSRLLFGPPGIAYVYLNYGIHWLFNVVTEKEGIAGAVLIRAVEPVSGGDIIQRNRPKIVDVTALTNGPGKLTQALGISPTHNGQKLYNGKLYFAKSVRRSKKELVEASPRIGISQGKDLHWRFFEKANAFVSITRGL